MAKFKVFIDGQVGTTGLQIIQRLQHHENIDLIKIADKDRKDISVKKEVLNSVDLVVLCLPDEASRESVSLISNPAVKVLDASTAHRTDPSWVYGLPEFDEKQRDKIKKAKFVSVPGCYATGFVVAVHPLVKAGIIPSDYPITIQAVSGYSGGGKKLIESYQENETKGDISKLWIYRPYALQLQHKHLPEMQYYTGLKHKPVFVPAVGHFYQGMLVMIPLYTRLLKKRVSVDDIVSEYRHSYQDEPFISLGKPNDSESLENGFLSPLNCNSSNKLDLKVFGNEDQILLVSRLDNLGKGASGAAVQNLNLMLGLNENSGLI